MVYNLTIHYVCTISSYWDGTICYLHIVKSLDITHFYTINSSLSHFWIFSLITVCQSVVEMLCLCKILAFVRTCNIALKLLKCKTDILYFLLSPLVIVMYCIGIIRHHWFQVVSCKYCSSQNLYARQTFCISCCLLLLFKM